MARRPLPRAALDRKGAAANRVVAGTDPRWKKTTADRHKADAPDSSQLRTSPLPGCAQIGKLPGLRRITGQSANAPAAVWKQGEILDPSGIEPLSPGCKPGVLPLSLKAHVPVNERKRPAAEQRPEEKEAPPDPPPCARGQRRRRVPGVSARWRNPEQTCEDGSRTHTQDVMSVPVCRLIVPRRGDGREAIPNCMNDVLEFSNRREREDPGGVPPGSSGDLTRGASDHPGGPGREGVRLVSSPRSARFPFTALAMTTDRRASRPAHHDIDTFANARVAVIAGCLVVEGDMAFRGGRRWWKRLAVSLCAVLCSYVGKMYLCQQRSLRRRRKLGWQGGSRTHMVLSPPG